MLNPPLALGIDVGTSGVRAVVLDGGGAIVAEAAATMPAEPRRTASEWWNATAIVLEDLARRVPLSSIAAFAVDGTSGTLVAVDEVLAPVAPPSMYNERCKLETLARIEASAPPASAALGATSALGRAIELQAARPYRILHQADWIGALLAGRIGPSDENNALKTGYDAVTQRWPHWLATAGLDMSLLPEVVPAGCIIGAEPMSAAARSLGFAPGTIWVAGTTDGCAAFLATGAEQPGEGVTSLGSTLVLKLLSDRPVFAPHYGIYSHRLGNMWLAGGASNSGGAVLLQHFTPERMRELEPSIAADRDSGLDYYPLAGKGERFPVNDPSMASRVQPVPMDDVVFLQGLLEGIANVEALGYRRLAEAGAPKLVSLRTAGGGAANTAWTDIRRRKLAVPFLPAFSEAAAAGTARLALNALGAAR